MDLAGFMDLVMANFHLVYVVMLIGFAIYFSLKSGMYRRMRDDADGAGTTIIALKLVAAQGFAGIKAYLLGYLKYVFHFFLMLFILGIIYGMVEFEYFVMFALALALARINVLLREMSKPKYLILTPEELKRFNNDDKEIRKLVTLMEEPKDLNKIKAAMGLTVEGKPK